MNFPTSVKPETCSGFVEKSAKVMKFVALLALAAALSSADAHAISLTSENYDELVVDSGKNAFIKPVFPTSVVPRAFLRHQNFAVVVTNDP